MKRAIIIGMLLLTGVGAAHADYYETTYHDVIRPHGKPRSDAIYQANLDACYSKTREDRTQPDTPAFRQCMLVHGYSFLAMREVKTTPVQSANSGITVTVSHGGTPNDDAYGVSDADSDAMEAAGLQDMQNVIDANIAATNAATP
jgi:hypothetical protein